MSLYILSDIRGLPSSPPARRGATSSTTLHRGKTHFTTSASQEQPSHWTSLWNETYCATRVLQGGLRWLGRMCAHVLQGMQACAAGSVPRLISAPSSESIITMSGDGRSTSSIQTSAGSVQPVCRSAHSAAKTAGRTRPPLEKRAREGMTRETGEQEGGERRVRDGWNQGEESERA